MAVAGCIIKDNVYYDNEWVYYHPHREYVGEEPKGSPNAFADGHASWVDYKDMVVFQAYTRHSAYTRNWWPHPYKSH
jgi:hypothetical protein